jgi:hypothetical protein
LQYWTVVPLPHFFVVVENRCDFTNPMWVYRVVVFLYLPDLLGTRIFSTSLSFGLSGWSSKVDCDDILCRQFNTPFVVFDVWFRHCNRFFYRAWFLLAKACPALQLMSIRKGFIFCKIASPPPNNFYCALIPMRSYCCSKHFVLCTYLRMLTASQFASNMAIAVLSLPKSSRERLPCDEESFSFS